MREMKSAEHSDSDSGHAEDDDEEEEEEKKGKPVGKKSKEKPKGKLLNGKPGRSSASQPFVDLCGSGKCSD